MYRYYALLDKNSKCNSVSNIVFLSSSKDAEMKKKNEKKRW